MSTIKGGQFTGIPEGCPETVDMGSSSVGLLDATPGQTELGGRLPLTAEELWGVEIAPSGIACDF